MDAAAVEVKGEDSVVGMVRRLRALAREEEKVTKEIVEAK